MDSRKNRTYETHQIEINGIVQGVGFRPFVCKLADEYDVKGSVKNKGANVQMTLTGTKEQLVHFIKALQRQKPKASIILHIIDKVVPYKAFEDFSIEPSEEGEEVVMVSPDLPLCKACHKELMDSQNRRFKHPFISCMVCGPRYSIIDKLPYDRDHTSMVDFKMCSACETEYTSRKNRRYHAQTISCYECGPKLLYKAKDGKCYREEEAYEKAIEVLNKGDILAVKGIGGYHLVCSPFKHEAVSRLRSLKHRDMKPFAVMFRSLEELEQYAYIEEAEKELLISQATPIVLVRRKMPSSLDEEVYKESRYIGSFLPYTPLQYLLLKACGPLIMTSANLQQQPIIKDDEKIESLFFEGLEGVLYNDREIRVSLDDSVVACEGSHKLTLRRSRGYAPMPLYLEEQCADEPKGILAMGGDLKACFALGKGGFVYPSEYLGDMEEQECFKNYQERFQKLQSLFQIKPQYVVCDAHPYYFTSQLARTLNLPVLEVQHHHAHIASVMAEHHLKQVIGVAFDGTGYGTDGSIWGSEFLVCDETTFKRRGHLKPLVMIGGDEALKDVAKTLYCYLKSIGEEVLSVDPRKTILKAALEKKINTYETSSMGRLFDAVAGLLKVCEYNSYEGRAGILLENLAAEALENEIAPVTLAFRCYKEKDRWVIDYDQVLKRMIEVGHKQTDLKALALGFHKALARITVQVVDNIAKEENLKTVALSGGVFQNLILLKLIRQDLQEKGYQVFVNEKIPPNDGGLCVGQYYVAYNSVLKGV